MYNVKWTICKRRLSIFIYPLSVRCSKTRSELGPLSNFGIFHILKKDNYLSPIRFTVFWHVSLAKRGRGSSFFASEASPKMLNHICSKQLRKKCADSQQWEVCTVIYTLKYPVFHHKTNNRVQYWMRQ
jgi:hypothetical protein